MTHRYSYSQIQLYAECPTKYKFRYVDTLVPIGGESEHDLRFGKAIDAALNAYYYEGMSFLGERSILKAKQAFVLAYPESEYPTALPYWSPGKTFQNGLNALDAYAEHWQEDDQYWQVIGVQSSHRNEEDVDSDRLVKIDLVIRDTRDGLIYGVDHKAQPLNSNLLTPEGWLPMGRVQINDSVIGSDGFPVTVIGIFPQGKLPCYEVGFNDGSYVRCSEDHLWTGWFSHQISQQAVTVTVRQIRERLARSGAYRFRVPFVEPVQFSSRPLPLHPYLLGTLLGDGCLSEGKSQISVGGLDTEELLGYIGEFLPKGISLRKSHYTNYTWTLSSDRPGKKGANSITNALRVLRLYGSRSDNKFIPEEYLLANAQQRTALLQGLLDTDGCCWDGHIYFDSVSVQLSQDVVHLVRSLGGYAKVRMRVGTKQQAYRVSIRFENDVIPFRLKRKLANRRKTRTLPGKYITSIKYVGEEEMQCIQVAAIDGLYVTDGYTVTHNTTGKYLDKDYSAKFDPHSQIRQYVDRIQRKYGECGGFYINALSFRHRTKAYTPRSGPDKGVQLPAGDWYSFKRLVFTPNSEAINAERSNFDSWVAKIKSDRESGQWSYNTDQCVKGPIICPYHQICSVGYQWPRDSELILNYYQQRCIRLANNGERCWLEPGHEGEHDPTRPQVQETEIDFAEEEIEEAVGG